ncbi:MAG: type II/IV secretion system ATPase subunit [Candidatus Woesearchaeota archaeon]
MGLMDKAKRRVKVKKKALPKKIVKISKKKSNKVKSSVKKPEIKKSKAVKKPAAKSQIKKSKNPLKKTESESKKEVTIEEYKFISDKIPVDIKIYRTEAEYVPLYSISISKISKTTEMILERIRKELIKEVNLGIINIADYNKEGLAQQRFKDTIGNLIKKYFPDANKETSEFLSSYLIQKSLGMGNIEILDDDPNLEEIVINSAGEPVWVYHKKHGWLKTNIIIEDEERIKHFSAMLGRKVGRQISVLEPLMDANIVGGDRVNATLKPISTAGNTITLRKYSAKPWTITDFILSKTMSVKAAAFIWHCIQYELSTLIAGGTASGKTSSLNVITNFFPPNQRTISIEDTREIQLPKYAHWVPLLTRQPNTEGKGGISMLDLLVNSLRMRPDRVIVGEIRRKKEAEILFEAIHTGHSVFATVHANNTKETITRLTSPPIEIPKSMLPAIALIVIQYRNRRTGLRRTFQVAEMLDDGSARILMQYNPSKDCLEIVNKSKRVMETLEMYTGQKRSTIEKEIVEKEKILAWLVKHKINDIDEVGRIMAEFYTRKENLMRFVNKGIPLR